MPTASRISLGIKSEVERAETTTPSSPYGMPPSFLQLHEVNSFAVQVLMRIKRDEVGAMATTDPTILMVGKFLWAEIQNKVDKAMEGRKSVIKAMRRLALLSLKFREKMIQSGKDIAAASTANMFERSNFLELEESVVAITGSADGLLKYGLKNEIKYLVRKGSSYSPLKLSHSRTG